MQGKASTVLVTGGAGYIGSHVVLALRDAGVGVVVLDTLETGFRSAVPPDVPLVEGSTGNRDLVGDTLERFGVSAVMHFAASLVVPQSIEQPLAYYRNNTANSLALIEACVAVGIERFVFSSTAAVYGIPNGAAIAESATTEPINPYGRSKLMTEWMLRDAAAASRLRYVALRYFNVAGGDPTGRAGQSTVAATHLIKVACEAAVGRRPGVTVFGDDYPTQDGTCIRDYIHVSDLAQAHLDALGYLEADGISTTLNCGYGKGFSVNEVLETMTRVAGTPLAVTMGPRRAGDPPSLVAANDAIRKTLGWRPRYDDLDLIARTALDWERKMP